MTTNADYGMHLRDVRERLERADRELDNLKNKAAANHALTEYSRLGGKQEGVRLALDYLRDPSTNDGKASQ